MKKSAFKFIKPTIESFDYKVKEDCNLANLRGKAVPISFGTEVFISEEEKTAKVNLSIKTEDTEDFPFVFTIVMSSKVKWDEDVPADMLESILNKNVPAMILSYARPIISMITSHSEYKPLEIPFLDLRNIEDDEKIVDDKKE